MSSPSPSPFPSPTPTTSSPTCPPCVGKDGKPLEKSWATILNSDQPFRLKSTPYKAERKKKFVRELPVQFNPIDRWGFFLTTVRNQGNCGACWAMASAKTLSDRYSILSVGGLLEDFSAYMMVACEGTIFPGPNVDDETIRKLNLDAHTAGACNGNTLTNSMDYLYAVGCVTNTCINPGLFTDYQIPNLATVEDPSKVPLCTNMLSKTYDRCLNRTKAARFYRTITGYEVENTVEAIKLEIYKWGPVLAGMRMFDNFTRGYDGVSIYMGPEPHSKSMGGHAVEICGWGREGDVDFWWICNSWGSAWGMSGYFRMKMNIKEVELEENVVGFVPDFPGFTTDMIEYKVEPRSGLKTLREFMGVDPITGYPFNLIPKIENGELQGDLQPIFAGPLPDMNTTWLGDVTNNQLLWKSSFDTWQRPRFQIVYDFNWWVLIGGVLFCVVMYFIGKYLAKRKTG